MMVEYLFQMWGDEAEMLPGQKQSYLSLLLGLQLYKPGFYGLEAGLREKFWLLLHVYFSTTYFVGWTRCHAIMEIEENGMSLVLCLLQQKKSHIQLLLVPQKVNHQEMLTPCLKRKKKKQDTYGHLLTLAYVKVQVLNLKMVAPKAVIPENIYIGISGKVPKIDTSGTERESFF